MNDRPIPYHIQSAVVTQILTELIEKHPELLVEVKKYLAPLPEPVGLFVFRELKYRSHPYDPNELTRLWSNHTDQTQSTDRASNRSRVRIQRSRR